MKRGFLDQLLSSREDRKGIQREDLIGNFNDLVHDLMQRENVTKKELADRLGKSRSFVTQLLDGSYNPSLKTISDVLFELGYAMNLQAAPRTTVLTYQIHERTANESYQFVQRKRSAREQTEEEYLGELETAAA